MRYIYIPDDKSFEIYCVCRTEMERMHCQLVCVILRTILNLILLGTNQILPPPAKDDNNSTAADVKSISTSSLNQMFSHDSVAYLTLKPIYDRKLVSFCLLNLDHLLQLWMNQSPTDQKNSEKEFSIIKAKKPFSDMKNPEQTDLTESDQTNQKKSYSTTSSWRAFI